MNVVHDPLHMMRMKQRFGQQDANKLILPVLLYLDAAHRGVANMAAEQALIRVIVVVQVLAYTSKNKALHAVSEQANAAMLKACSRDRTCLAFTTREYQKMRHLVAAYVRILPDLELASFVFACNRTEEILNRLQSEPIKE